MTAAPRVDDDYLAAAVAWLRLLLAHDAGAAAARDELTAFEGADPPPRFVRIADTFGLTPFERSILLLCVAMELDTRIAGLCATAQGNERPFPTFALALTLFPDDAAWEALSPDRPLRAWHLIEVMQRDAHPLTATALRADERIVNEIKGLSHIDERLMPSLFPLDIAPDPAPPPPSAQSSIVEIMEFVHASRDKRLPVLVLSSGDRDSRQMVAARVAESLGVHIVRLVADLLPASSADVELLVRLWNRETLLLPVALYIDAESIDESSKASLRRFLLRATGLVFLDTRETAAESLNVRVFDVEKPTAVEQRETWQKMVGDASTAARLASHYDMSMPALRRIESEIVSLPGDASEHARRAAAAHARPALGTLAQKIDARATWDDIVLPEPERRLLERVAEQMSHRTTVYDDWGFRSRMNRGLGVNALFVGDSGTGKTMAAEVLANELGLELYRVDLANVLNKYIGETEKNLARVFDKAAGAIILFDEAEALFGKRVEARDSNDRYANIEVAYLLQRIEAYRGLAILTTNKRGEIDSAFLRRIRFLLHFPFPAIEQRKEIWRRALPAGTPVHGVDFDRLARLTLAGGSVHTIALNAAFAAASRNMPVTMPLLLEAARIELRKLEKPFNEADLKWLTEERAS